MPACFPDETGHRGPTEYELRVLEDYFRVAEAIMPIAEDRARNELEERAASLEDDNDVFVVAMQAVEQAKHFRNSYPQRLRYGYFIQLYTLLEERGRSLCAAIISKNNLSVNGLGRRTPEGFVYAFRDWIQEHTEVDTERWIFLDCVRIIRNCIAHSNGLVVGDRDEERTRETIQGIEGISVQDNGFLALDSSFCMDAHAQIRGLFDEIYTTVGFGTTSIFHLGSPDDYAVVIDQSGDKPTFHILGEDDELP